MESKHSNRTKNIEQIMSAFNKMHKFPKALMKFGTYIFVGILVIGMILVILNNTLLQYDPYLDTVSKEIVKTSFIIEAEAIIGSLIMDYVFRK